MTSYIDFVALGTVLVGVIATVVYVRTLAVRNAGWIEGKGQPHVEDSNIHVPADLLVFRETCKGRHEVVHEVRDDLKTLVRTVTEMDKKLAVVCAKINGEE